MEPLEFAFVCVACVALAGQKARTFWLMYGTLSTLIGWERSVLWYGVGRFYLTHYSAANARLAEAHCGSQELLCFHSALKRACDSVRGMRSVTRLLQLHPVRLSV